MVVHVLLPPLFSAMLPRLDSQIFLGLLCLTNAGNEGVCNARKTRESGQNRHHALDFDGTLTSCASRLEDCYSSEVQLGQRVALRGMVEKHFGHSLVVVSTGRGSSLRRKRFICLMTRKMAKATITKSSIELIKAP